MAPVTSIPLRQLHLDFHTSPLIPDVGCAFDGRAFAQTLKTAHIQSVNLFAKCHHGHLYYATDRPERHPALPPDLDLLGEQVEALHRAGIRAPIYISIQCDEYAARAHPEWVARNPDSSEVKWSEPVSVFQPGWRILDMSSPYQEFVAEQIAEVLERFRPVDGIWFDMCWDQPSAGPWAIAGMERAGLDPENEQARAVYARQVAHGYMRRFRDMVKGASPDATIYFNGRLFPELAQDIEFQEQIELECLPSGGWGYTYFPMNVRYARTFGKPYLGMTGRFHKMWGDFGGLKPYPALEYETSQMMAAGAGCSIGDQLHPRGKLDPASYDLVGQAFARVEAREPWLVDARPVTEVGVFLAPSGSKNWFHAASESDIGVTRMLTQLRQQFDFTHVDGDWSRFRLLILPDSIAVDAAFAGRLEQFAAGGGRILCTGISGLSPDARSTVLPMLPVAPAGMSEFSTTYFRFAPPLRPTDHVMYERGVAAIATEGAETLAAVVAPYFERKWNHFCSHFQTPPDTLTGDAAAVALGPVGYISYPVFRAFALHANVPYRGLVAATLERLLPDPLLRTTGPSGLEATVTEQAGRRIVHLLYYVPERRAPGLDLVEDIIPLSDIEMSLRCAARPSRVYLAPEERDLPYVYDGQRVAVTVPQVRGHAMVVVETQPTAEAAERRS